MVLCRFYAQGNCRYGNNCNFEHTRGSNSYSTNNTDNRQYNSYNQQSRIPRYNNNNNNDNYRYDARQNIGNNNRQQNFPSQPSNPFSRLATNNQQNNKPTQSKVDPENIVNMQDFIDLITNDFNQWLESSSFWKLSSYKFNKKALNLPILEDFSNEEARYALYEAKKQNRYNEELQQFQMKYNQVLETIKEIANPNQQTNEYLMKYFHESVNKQNAPQQSEPAVNPFAQIIQKKQQELQTQPAQSSFLQNTTPVHGFLQQQQTNQIQTTGSFLFTDQQKPVAATTTNLFANIASPQPAANPFTQIASPQPVNPFTQIATSPAALNTQPGLFTTNQNSGGFFNQPTVGPNTNPLSSFNNANIQSTAKVEPDVNPNPKVYSDLAELSEQDIKEYKENRFTLGLIPHLPPTRLLCM